MTSEIKDPCPNLLRYEGEYVRHERGSKDNSCNYCDAWIRRQNRRAK
jgi:hypothetical protein